MIVLGLTGSIGMGKSTTAAMFRQLGIPVYDADAAIHRLQAPGGAAVGAILREFPGTDNEKGGIDRGKLGPLVFADPAALARLEAILHPMAAAEQRRFLRAMRRRRVRLVVLDVPLLFETGGKGRCDMVLVVSAPAAIQKARVMARPGMTRSRLAAILAKQMPDREKRRRADFVLPSGLGRAVTLRHLRRIVREIMKNSSGTRPPRRASRYA